MTILATGEGNRPRPDSATLLAIVGILVLVVSGPFLAFPTLVASSVRTPIVVGAATLCVVLAGLPASKSGRLSYLLWPFAFFVLAAWFRAPDARQLELLQSGKAFDALGYVVLISPDAEALEHLAGIALGLLTMSTLAAWANSPNRLSIAAAAFSLAGTAVLVLGMAGTSRANFSAEYSKFFTPSFARELPAIKLPLPGLGKDGWVNPNALGATALLVAPVNVALVFAPTWMVGAIALRVVGTISTIVAILVLAFTQSRSVWLACLVTLLLFALRFRRNSVTRGRVLVAVIGLFMVALIYAGTSQRFSLDQAIASAGDSATDRLFIWRFALGQLAASPWLGIGLNQFHVVDPHLPWPLIVAHAHNELIQVALDLGLIGLFTYASLQILLLVRADQTARGSSAFARNVAVGGGMSLVALHLFGLADVIALGAKVGLFQWVVAGLIMAAWSLRETPDPRRTK